MGVNYNGSLFVWGINKDGLLGLGYNITEVESPTELLYNIKELSISENHAVAINIEGEVYSWGSGKYGELCQDKIIYCPFPTKKNLVELKEDINYTNNNLSPKNPNTHKNLMNNINSRIKKYKKVFCSDLLTCFIDEDGLFSYYGVIIKIFKGSASSITIKSLLKDENNSDPNVLFQEKFVYELEGEKFTQVAIGNGFIGLLSEKGLVYSIDHSDNITLLYTKYCVYSISVSNNQLFGLCKNNNTSALNITTFNPPSIKNQGNNSILNNNELGSGFGNRSNLMNKTEDEEISANLDNTQNNNFCGGNLQQMNYFLCRWIAQYGNNYIITDSWSTTLYRINNEEKDLENMFLLNSSNKEVLFVMQYTNMIRKQNSGNINTFLGQEPNSNINILDGNKAINKDCLNNINNQNQNSSVIENKAKSFFREATMMHENRMDNLNISGFIRKTSIIESNYSQNHLVLLGTYDDSYNLKYRRVKNNYQGLRNVSLDKSKNMNINIKTETDEISEKLNQSIRKKHTTTLQKQNSTIDIFQNNNIIGDINNNKFNNKNKLIEESNTNTLLNRNKNFRLSSICNMSGLESNVNYLLSPDAFNQKNSFDFTQQIKETELNPLKKSKVFNLQANFNNSPKEDKSEFLNDASNYEKGKN